MMMDAFLRLNEQIRRVAKAIFVSYLILVNWSTSRTFCQMSERSADQRWQTWSQDDPHICQESTRLGQIDRGRISTGQTRLASGLGFMSRVVLHIHVFHFCFYLRCRI